MSPAELDTGLHAGLATSGPPIDVLLRSGERHGPALSPDGLSVAWISEQTGGDAIWIGQISDVDDARLVTPAGGRVAQLAWSFDGRHLILTQDADGDESWQLATVRVADGHVTALSAGSMRMRILRYSPLKPESILVALNERNASVYDAFEISLITGERRLVMENPGFARWISNNNLEIVAGIQVEPDGSQQIFTPTKSADGWHPIMRIPYEDTASTNVISVEESSGSLWLRSSVAGNTAGLLSLSLDGSITASFRDSDHDVVSCLASRSSGIPQLAGVGATRTRLVPVDCRVAQDAVVLNALDGDVRIVDTDIAEDRWLVVTTSPETGERYFIYDRSTGRAEHLYDSIPELSKFRLAAMEPFNFRSKDGLAIEGLVSFPPTLEQRQLPCVVAVHGGPWARDTWGFNLFAQFFATRGYCCLQVNFRGSSGYGKAFLNAGDREWGSGMHDDLVGAVHHAVKAGWVDSRRVGISGPSYGGYAALMAVALAPDVFRCAMAVSAPVNLIQLVESIPARWAPMRANFVRRVGDPEREADLMRARSPLFRAVDIRRPVLIAHGARDPRSPVDQVEQLVRALREQGSEVDYHCYRDAGHGLTRRDDLRDFMVRAELFLARYLGENSS